MRSYHLVLLVIFIKSLSIMGSTVSATSLFQNLKSGSDHFIKNKNLSLDGIFNDSSYLNYFNLYTKYFNRIPNFINEPDIDCEKAVKWFIEKYQADISDFYFDKIFSEEKGEKAIDDVFLILYDDLLVQFDTGQSKVRFLFKLTSAEKIEDFILKLKKFKRSDKNGPNISLVMKKSYGFESTSLTLGKPRLNLKDNYNDDFLPVHQLIVRRLNVKKGKGIVLLHGQPGTGKTSYIRYLASKIKKKLIFLPPNLANHITCPDFIPFLIENKNSILVIEDAENVVADRDQDGNSGVSALLNLSDGLLSDCLNIQIICSFNIDISRIDKALVRKGRIIAMYEFKELELEKAQVLSAKLGLSQTIWKPCKLTDVYNHRELEFDRIERKTIGFLN